VPCRHHPDATRRGDPADVDDLDASTVQINAVGAKAEQLAAAQPGPGRSRPRVEQAETSGKKSSATPLPNK
jgi:hypothetical protein